MNFKSAFSLSVVLNVAKVLSGLIINKMVAVLFGPAGMVTFGQFQNLYGILLSVSNASCQTGVLQSCAASRKESDHAVIVGNALLLTALCSFFLIVFLLFSKNYVEDLLLYDLKGNFYLIPALIVFSGINLVFVAYANAKGLFKRFFVMSIAVPVLTALLVICLSKLLMLTGVLVSVLVANFIVSIGIYFKFKGFINKSIASVFFGVDFKTLRNLLSFGVVTFVSGLALSLAMIFSRGLISEIHSVVEAGYWDSLYRFSIYYNMIFMVPFSIYFFPRMALCSKKEVRFNLILVFCFYLPIMLGLVVFAYMFSDFLIVLIYTEQFLPISEYVYLMFFSESFKVFFAIFCSTILAKNGKLLFVFLEVLWAVMFVVLSYFFSLEGVGGVMQAYLYASMFSCLVGFVLCLYGKFGMLEDSQSALV